jgi:carbonic anhydrase
VREKACSIIPATRRARICSACIRTPVGDLVEYHNLRMPARTYERAAVVVGMCMDNSRVLRLPESFAYVLRVFILTEARRLRERHGAQLKRCLAWTL